MKNQMTELLEIAGISIPPIGVYDVPDASPFQPFAKPSHCIFGRYDGWLQGESTVINGENAASYGCSGAGYWLCGIETLPKAAVADYLAGQEGLKVSTDLMCQWLENHPPYRMVNASIVVSQVKDDQEAFLKTVTFFVNPDQLGLLLTGAEYRNASPDKRLVMAPYGSGCGQMLAMFPNLDEPKAMIGATDIAARKYLPENVLAFTVTKPLFEELCGLDDDSFLNKTFWREVRDVRAKHRHV